LTLRGYDVEKLLRECIFAEKEDRPMNWLAGKTARKPSSADDMRSMQG